MNDVQKLINKIIKSDKMPRLAFNLGRTVGKSKIMKAWAEADKLRNENEGSNE